MKQGSSSGSGLELARIVPSLSRERATENVGLDREACNQVRSRQG